MLLALPSTCNAEAAAVVGAATALATAGAAGPGGAVGAAGAGDAGASGSGPVPEDAFPKTARAAEEDKVALGSVDCVEPTAPELTDSHMHGKNEDYFCGLPACLHKLWT